jgi:hypothetical protein
MTKSTGTLQEYRTTLAADEVLAMARRFFSRGQGIYSSFPDKDGPGWVSFRGQGGEEIVIAASPSDGATRVTGSTYLFDMQLARFFSTLPEAKTTATAAAPAEVTP